MVTHQNSNKCLNDRQCHLKGKPVAIHNIIVHSQLLHLISSNNSYRFCETMVSPSRCSSLNTSLHKLFYCMLHISCVNLINTVWLLSIHSRYLCGTSLEETTLFNFFFYRWGHLNVASYLVESCGVDTNAKNTNNETPLHLACK